MKKLCYWIFGTLFAMVLSVGLFASPNSSGNQTFAATTKESYSLLSRPGLASISQDGKVFDSEDDFTKLTFYDGVDYPTIYTNKTLTISILHHFAVLDYYSIHLITYENGEQNTIKLGDNSGNSSSNYYYEYYKNDEYLPCYVFSSNNTKQDEAVLIKISFTVDNNVYNLDFVLVQTSQNFQIIDSLYWDYRYNGISEKVNAPTVGATYAPMSLHIPNGTALNPVYVRFTFLGNEFMVYNIDGKFYNEYDKSLLDFEYLTFDQSGTYTVEVFDKTSLCYANANYFKYEFLIKNTTNKNDSFYIHAHNEDGTLVANNQITNTDVIVDLVNLNDVVRNIDRVIVTKSWRPSGGENISEQTEYTTNIPTSIKIQEDGTYNIRVIGKNGGNIIKEYEFVLVKSIRTYFEMGTQKYEIGEDEPANTYKTFNIETSIVSSYQNIYGKTDYSFDVTIAKSSPEISGINNNGRKEGGVTLTIYGVGKIQVAITQDGKTTNLEVSNGQQLDKLTTAGKYYVKVTDEMGTTITKSFTISVKMNTAAKAIIIVGVILVVGFIALIIFTRAKIKVR